MTEIELGGNTLPIPSLVSVCRDRAPVRLAEDARGPIARSRQLIERWVEEGRVIYGVTTGFGALAEVRIDSADARQLQENILMSHAAGVGPPLAEEIVRGTMALRVHDLAKGYAGIRAETLEAMIALLNAGVTPVVPEKGSVGASGDLAPMAHLALVLLGMGEAFYDGERLSGREALAEAEIAPIHLEAGEGLALINGTQVMTAVGALAVHDAGLLMKTADVAGALSLEVLMGTNTEFDPRIHALRPHRGQAETAENMDRITRGSEIISSHKDCGRVQDAYTLRCSPQIHGASRDALRHARSVVETEIDSSTTNPLIFADTEQVLSGGNFHGQPVALAMDYLCMALAEVANVSERRIERLVNPQLSGLPAFLVEDSGLNSGFMIAQYTAAALVSENKVLSHPACVDSIPTSAGKEDHVSMGLHSALKARRILENVQNVIAIELLCGCQAKDLLTVGPAGPGTEAAYRTIREAVPRLDRDRVLALDIDAVTEMVRASEILGNVEEAVGEMK
jgi:histidine ammonia-lyase